MPTPIRPARLLRFRHLFVMAVSFAVVGAAVVAWAGSAAWTLSRLDGRLAEECSRVEAASRARTVLVRNLIDSCRSFGGSSAVHVESLEQALDDVEPARLSPGTARLGAPYAQRREAELELSSAIADFWDAARRSPDERSERLVGDLESRINHATLRLESAMVGLTESMAEYRRASDTLPGSILGLIFGSEPGEGSLWDPQASGGAAVQKRPSG